MLGGSWEKESEAVQYIHNEVLGTPWELLGQSKLGSLGGGLQNAEVEHLSFSSLSWIFYFPFSFRFFAAVSFPVMWKKTTNELHNGDNPFRAQPVRRDVLVL